MISRPTISAVIPTYNGKKQLHDNLPEILRCLHSTDELIIIDDASTDDSVEWLIEEYELKPSQSTKLFNIFQNTKSSFPAIKVVSMKNNVRFAQAVNRGVEFVTSEWMFLLNNDVIPSSSALDSFARYYSDSSVFAVGCLEYENSNGGTQSGKNELWFERGLFMHRRAADFSAGPTAWASGGSGLFNVEKWRKLGGFDASFYPAYWEDVDLSFRAKKRGWKVLFEPQAIVIHNHETTNTAVFGKTGIDSISWKNQFLFTRKHANAVQLLQHLLWLPYWSFQEKYAGSS